MKEPLTQKEKAVYDYYMKVKKAGGVTPSFREIQIALNMKSTASVHTLVKRLEDKGLISYEKGKSRSVVALDNSPAVTKSASSSLCVPVIGRVAAGSPILAAENHEFYIDFPKREGYFVDTELFGLKVKGTSMIGAGIMPDDIVIIAKTDYCKNGDIIVALIDDEATVKRFYKENGQFRLQPENPDMKPIILPFVTILGKVISVVRYYSNT